MRSKYIQYSKLLDPINLDYSTETDKASSFNSKKTMKLGKIRQSFDKVEIK